MGPILFGSLLSRPNTSLILAPCLPPLDADLNSGRTLSKSDQFFWSMLSLSWAMVVLFVFGGIGGVEMLLWLLNSQFCFPTVLSRTSPSRRWRRITGIWLFVVPCLLKSWKTGKASLPCSPALGDAEFCCLASFCLWSVFC